MRRFVIAQTLRRIDFLILIPVIALTGFGLISIYSATQGTAMIVKFEKQILWIVLGGLSALAVVLASPRFYHYTAYFVYALSILLLILVLFFGKTVGGNAGWFGIGSYGIQPSEFAKIGTVLALARFLSDRATSLHSFRDLLTAIAIVLLPWLLIVLQPDFGTGLVYWALFIPMIIWAGAEIILLLTLLSPIIVSVISILDLWIFLAVTFLVSAVFYLMKRNIGVALLFLALNLACGFAVQYMYEHLPEYQKARISVFLDPSRSPQSAGWNIIQSKVAIGSGGITGQGYLQGSQTQLRFVPEQWTDFIFCVPAEEFGFIGAIAIIALFSVVSFRGLQLARSMQSRFSSLMMIGLIAIIVVHVFTNIGMATGLLPVVGIPLPFLSYGGSSYITSMIGVGLMLHSYAHRQEPEF